MEEDVQSIIGVRDSLGAEDKLTTAWLVIHGAVTLETFDLVAPWITTRGRQFTVESLGYGDHIGMVVRLQVRFLLADYSDMLSPAIDIENPEPFTGQSMQITQ